MKICAIICEYNPFHTGHLYQLMQAAKRFDETICIMSGNFVQRAEPAIVEKATRAEIALRAGASMVLEMPVVYATANGERFARGAVKTLSRLSQLDAIVMGCETDDTDVLLSISKIQTEECQLFKETLSAKLSQGLPYATAITDATVACAKEAGRDPALVHAVLNSPNNLLCIEYIKAINEFCPSVKPVFIKRIGNAYNDFSKTGNYLSATALRDLIANGNFTAALPFLPEYDLLSSELNDHSVDYGLFSKLCVFALRESTPEKIAAAFDCREGIEHKLYENALRYIDINTVLNETKSKRYTMGRLKRIVLQVLLGIDKVIMDTDKFIPPRLIAIKEKFKPYLTENGKNMIIRAADFERYEDDFYLRYFEIEKRAANIYSLLTDKNENLFIPQKLITL